ncbi:MAG TPA: TonB-dependent receptor, partial [Steroidobacter sp.]
MAEAVQKSGRGARTKLAALSVSVSAVLAVAALVAEGAEPQAASQSTAESTSDTSVTPLDTIVVTGSRIRTAGFDAPTPTTVVGEVELGLAGRTDIGATLADLPQFRLTQSATSTNVFTTSGITPADLRGLGAARTLVLVNNRRYVSQGDLQAVPYALVERIDVVTGGVSAAYGSDAVAGVVNVILDDDKEGLELGVQVGRSTHGDGDKYLFEASGGTPFADGRGHFVMGLDYLQDKGVTPGISRPRVGAAGFYPGEDGLLYPTMHLREALRSEGGLINTGVLAGQTFEPDGTLRPFQYGVRSPLAPANMIGGEGYHIDKYASLSAPIERANALAHLTWDLNDNTKLWVEGVFNRTEDERPFFPELTINQVTLSADNPFLRQEIRDTLAAAGETTFTMGRVLSDVAFNKYDYDDTTRQFSIGVDGTFGSSNWRYEAFYSYGEKTRNQRVHDLIQGAEFFNAIDAVLDPVSGEIVCRIALTDPTTDCAPLNLFGSGVASPEAIDYVTGHLKIRADTWLQNVGFSVSGEPFRIWDEPVAFAFGGEYRETDFASHYDQDSLAGRFLLIRGVDIDRIGIDVKEAFAEVAVPLLVDVPFAKKLMFNGAARNSDYSTSGSIWSWKLGATWDVIDDVRFRLTRSRDIRAPNLQELFTAAGVVQATVSDLGRPGAPQTQVRAHGGGNRNLEPELADTFTAGVLLSPRALPGFNFAVDYYDIEINDVIAQLSAQLVVNSCYNDGIQNACNQIQRDANGVITDINITWINIAQFKTRGLDFEAAYRTHLDSLGGSLSIR